LKIKTNNLSLINNINYVMFLYGLLNNMLEEKKIIELPEDLYNALQELKQVFSQLTWEEIKEDSDVIWILVSGFIDSMQELQEQDNQQNQNIITDGK